MGGMSKLARPLFLKVVFTVSSSVICSNPALKGIVKKMKVGQQFEPAPFAVAEEQTNAVPIDRRVANTPAKD